MDATEARWLASGANAVHGLRRSSEDKRRAVKAAIALRSELSNRAIADHVGVDDKTVASVRASFPSAEIPKMRTASRGGKE